MIGMNVDKINGILSTVWEIWEKDIAEKRRANDIQEEANRIEAAAANVALETRGVSTYNTARDSAIEYLQSVYEHPTIEGYIDEA